MEGESRGEGRGGKVRGTQTKRTRAGGGRGGEGARGEEEGEGGRGEEREGEGGEGGGGGGGGGGIGPSRRFWVAEGGGLGSSFGLKIKPERPVGRHLRDVLARFGPMEMRRRPAGR